MISEKGLIINIISNDLQGIVKVNLSHIKKTNFTFNVYDNDKLIYAHKDILDHNYHFEFQINNPKLWNINHPNLYKYQIITDDENVIDHFGIRKLSTTKKYICVNDKPVFVRGYIRGASAHDHNNNLNCSLEDFYRKNIKMAKSFGFNFVRFHSTIPDDLFFKVADEEGILVHIEMRSPHDIYNNLEEMIETKNSFIDEKFIINTINRLFNHPSFAVYCLGNEIKNLKSTTIVQEIATEIKLLDPTRLFVDTCAWGENNRPFIDIDIQHLSYYFPFGRHSGMYDDVSILKVGDFNKDKDIVFNVPLLAHEVCHYTALRDFETLGKKFDEHHISRPWWINEELKMIEAKGYKNIYQDMYHASKEFQLSCWKVAFEEMRSSKLLGGFHFLQFADTDLYENSNGIVDCFDDINYVTPDRFLQFNGDIVLIIKNNKYNYYCNQNIKLPIYISRLDENLFDIATLKYQIISKSFEVTKQIDDIDISKHDYYQICDIDFDIPSINELEEATIKIELINNQQIISKNEYQIWIYPEQKKFTYNEFITYKDDHVVVTNNLENAIELLKQNKNVILSYRSDYTRHLLHKDMAAPKLSFKATWNRHKPVIWDRGTNFGGLIDNKLNKYGFNKYYNHNFCSLAEDADKIILDGILEKSTNLISGIDKCNRDRFDAYKGSFNLPELMYDRTLRNFSYLFEIGVGNSKLLVTGMNLLSLDNDDPSNNHFANTLIKYASSNEFNPSNKIEIEQLEQYLKESALKPVKERMMTQFWELDDTPVESKQYWIDSREYLKD